VKHSPYLVSDNLGIQSYYKEKFDRNSFFIPYGADPVTKFDPTVLKNYNVTPFQYLMVLARLEPENNIEMILDGYVKSRTDHEIIVIGKTDGSYGKTLINKYGKEPKIRFLGGIYDKAVLDSLRHFSTGYFHGHSVGGTNPSLLEAMACSCFILSHNNPFNKSVLGDNALFFQSIADVSETLEKIGELRTRFYPTFSENNNKSISSIYNWNSITNDHERLFLELLENNASRLK